MILGLILIVISCFLLLQATDAQEARSHWQGALTISEVGAIEEDATNYSVDCEFRETFLASIKDFGDGSVSQILGDIVPESIGTRCQIQNSQGSFVLNFKDDWNVPRHEAIFYSPNSSSTFAKWKSSMGTTKWFDPAPKGNNLLYLSRPSGYDRAYSVAVRKNQRDYTKIEIGQDYLTAGVNLDVQLEQTTLEYVDGTDATYGRHAFSRNGRYLVLRGGEGLSVVDTATFKRTMITSSKYGNMHQLAVTNDGNFVAILRDNRRIELFDVRKCTVRQEGGAWTKLINVYPFYDGCSVETELYNLMNDSGVFGINSELRRLYFSPADNQLYVSASSADATWKEYQITAEEWQSSAQGYLAMGDSFSSGEGDTEGGTWYEPGTDEQGDENTFAGRNLCHLSRRSYPYLIAVELGYLADDTQTPPEDGLFHSVACSGAKIHNIIGDKGEKHGDGSEADFATTDNQYRIRDQAALKNWEPGATAQINSLTGNWTIEELKREFDPEIITLGIGGNDADFGGFLKACFGIGTCEFAQPDTDKSRQIARMIAQSKPRLVKTYKQIKAASPESHVYVHGYPVFIRGEGGSCKLNVALDGAERAFAAKAISYHNQVVKAAAAEAGVFYIDVENILDGGRLCDEGPQLFNGLTAGNDIKLPDLKIIRNYLGNETYHPNPEGFKKYKEAIIAATNGLTADMPRPVSSVPTPVPADDIFGAATASYIQIITTSIDPTQTLNQRVIKEVDINPAATTIELIGLFPGSQAEVVQRSTPTSLGTFTVGDDGRLVATVALNDNEPGYHELHVIGHNSNGEPVDIYESFTIGVSDDDFDGDGVLNTEDSCPTVVNSGTDKDQDGIDDACDIEVTEPPQPPEEPEEPENPNPEPEHPRDRARQMVERLLKDITQALNKVFTGWLRRA